jgi:hypothetical protein
VKSEDRGCTAEVKQDWQRGGRTDEHIKMADRV